jgi:hypothetical protein
MRDKKTIQSNASAQTAAQYIEAIVQRDADLAAQPSTPYRVRRAVAPWLAVLIPILVGLTTFNVYSATRSRNVFDAAEQEAAVYFTMMIARADVEAYHDSTGTYPASLALLGLGELGIVYARSGDGYELRAPVGDSLVTYRPGQDRSTIETAFESLAELSR